MCGVTVDEQSAKEILGILKRFLATDTQVYAFGSRVKGTNKRFSDLDLALKSSNTILQSVFDSLNIAFENSLLPFKVDIIDLNNVDSEFKKAIFDDLIRIF